MRGVSVETVAWLTIPLEACGKRRLRRCTAGVRRVGGARAVVGAWDTNVRYQV
jgi:hypothetical protein